jgi:hypothetical protein
MIAATNHPINRFYMYGQHMRFLFLLWCALCVFAFPANSQVLQEETLSGPDSHETGQGRHGHLFGNWGGERTRLLERGVRTATPPWSLSSTKEVSSERDEKRRPLRCR